MLKRSFLSCVLCLSIVLFSGCSYAADPSKDVHKETFNQHSGERVIYHTQKGKLTHESVEDTVTVFTDDVEKSDIHTDVYIEAQLNEKSLMYALGDWEVHVLQNGDLFLADLNGDGVDEIVLFMEVTGNGGAIAQVFKVEENEIILLHDLNEVDIDLETIYQDGYIMLLENASVGFSEGIHIEKEFGPEHFDKNGRFTGASQVFLDPIHAGFVDSSTNLEYPTISCKRYIRLTNYLGELETTFQYDPETESLVLISMDLEAKAF